MDYYPLDIYNTKSYWGEIDEALKSAMLRNVNIKLLISHWNSTDRYMFNGLKSLASFNDFCNLTSVNDKYPKWCNGSIEIRIIKFSDPVSFVPYPFTRVNHAKYLINDDTVYISTNNWSKG
jgi:phospholipase D3/4